MITAAFLRHQWPKLHDYVVEECEALTARDARLGAWSPPGHPTLRLVARRGGCFMQWWLCCPTCGRRCGALYRPPGFASAEWRCRLCWSLVYASQRYGYRHPLRRRPTYRKRLTMQREILRQERTAARRMEQQRQRPPVSPEERAEEERAIEALQRFGDALEHRSTEIRARLEAEREPTLARLHELAEAPDPRMRASARRTLTRLGQQPAASPARGRSAGSPRRHPAVTFTRDDLEQMRRVMSESQATT